MLQEGLVDAVMPGHLLHRSVDNYWPALALCRAHAVLRTQLGWQGVVVSGRYANGRG
jgi:beta-glucosidase-like glycosyl hydrolase